MKKTIHSFTFAAAIIVALALPRPAFGIEVVGVNAGISCHDWSVNGLSAQMYECSHNSSTGWMEEYWDPPPYSTGVIIQHVQLYLGSSFVSEYYEAWYVSEGVIDSADLSPHGGTDTFWLGTDSPGDSIQGYAEFFGSTGPTSGIYDQAIDWDRSTDPDDPAGGLRSASSAPSGWNDDGALSRSMSLLFGN